MKSCKKSFLLLLGVALLLVAVLTGCAKDVVDDTTGELTLLDQMGREVLIEGEVERIVSLSPSNTEILFALGLSDKVVGVTDYCNYPPEAAEKDSVGGFDKPNIEVILTLEPDLVLAGSLHEEVVTRLEERDIPVLVIEPQTMEQIYEAIRTVGAAARVKEAAEAVVSEIEQQIDSVQEKLATLADDEKVSVYYELWYDPPDEHRQPFLYTRSDHRSGR